MKHTASVIFLILLMNNLPNTANAEETGLNVSAIIEYASYDSTEYRFGRVFNRETGIISGPVFQFEYRSHSWRVGAVIRDLDGLIDYDGQNQIGFPVQSKTDLEYSQRDFSAIYQFQTAVPVELGLVYRTRKIERRIRPTFLTQGLHETLRQTEWGPVLGILWQANSRLRFRANAKALKTSDSSLAVDFLGTYDAGELNMPDNWDHEIAVSAEYQMQENAIFTASIIHQAFNPSSSAAAALTNNGVVVGSYNYPGSQQEIWFYGVGIRVNW